MCSWVRSFSLDSLINTLGLIFFTSYYPFALALSSCKNISQYQSISVNISSVVRAKRTVLVARVLQSGEYSSHSNPWGLA
ncbi:MAG: hypothetical protein ACI9ES_002052, partial [Oceanospirillaceae bacterium]